MDSNERLPLIGVIPSQLAPRALVVGDQARAAQVAQLLTDAREIGHNREYYTYTGTYAGVPITVCSHGIGGPAASICFKELFQGGVKTIIRAGTCGAMLESIDDGQLVLATGAIREDGTSASMIPLSYPAIADRYIIRALEESAADQASPLHAGIILTQSFFYPEFFMPDNTEMWMKAGAVAIDMEMATLLVMAGLHGVRAGGILTSDGNVARSDTPDQGTSEYDPLRDIVAQGVQTMITIALEALAHA